MPDISIIYMIQIGKVDVIHDMFNNPPYMGQPVMKNCTCTELPLRFAGDWAKQVALQSEGVAFCYICKANNWKYQTGGCTCHASLGHDNPVDM